MATIQRNLYADLFTNFDKHPISDDVALKTNENAIRQSIRNILLTNRGERPFQPELGGDLNRLLFENITPQTIVLMEQVIRNTIEAYEPRANLIDVVVSTTPDQNTVAVTITFSVINRQEPVSLEVVLDRVR